MENNSIAWEEVEKYLIPYAKTGKVLSTEDRIIPPATPDKGVTKEVSSGNKLVNFWSRWKRGHYLAIFLAGVVLGIVVFLLEQFFIGTNSTGKIQNATMVFEKSDGELKHTFTGTATFAIPRIKLRDFIAEVTFTNPYELAEGKKWNYGLQFRETDRRFFVIAVNSDRYWYYGIFTTPNSYDQKDSNKSTESNINIAKGGTNTLRIIVRDRVGYFYINNRFITELDLSGNLESGSVAVETGSAEGFRVEGASTFYKNFLVMPLP